MDQMKTVNLPITLPDGWTAEDDAGYGVIITGIATCGYKGYVTVSESVRGFELGISMVRRKMAFSGRSWRKDLFTSAVTELKKALG
ncbi:TPA: hypothetical protein ACGWVL_001350 [Pseudomonas aeruginosa]